jgi:hypothetical protein
MGPESRKVRKSSARADHLFPSSSSRGIAVVEQTDDKEALVVLWNRLVLRIARKDIVLNQHNMRWECKAKNARGDDALHKLSLI